jgi:hypothetical protein
MIPSAIAAVLATYTNIICYALQSAALNINLHHATIRARTPLFSIEPPTDTEEEDATFFFRASRQAAKDRYEKLTNGEDPFGLFGSSVDKDSTAKPTNSIGESQSQEASPEESFIEPSVEPPTNQVMIQTSISASVGESTDNDSSPSQNTYNFHKRLLDARFAMETKKLPTAEPDTAEAVERERKKRLEAANKAKESVQSTQFEANSSSQPITIIEEEKTGPGCIRKVQDEAAEEKITYRNKNELLSSLYPEIAIAQEPDEDVAIKDPALSPPPSPPPPAAVVKMAEQTQTSIGKDDESFSLVEANKSDIAADKSGVNEENVAMGLLVLTRSFITLKQIVDSKKE